MRNSPSFRRDRMKKGIYVLPNLFTTANLFCGFYSAIASMKGMYEIAAVAILIAVVLDGLDCRRDLFYTGMTRATESVRVLCDKNSQGTILTWLARRADS